MWERRMKSNSNGPVPMTMMAATLKVLFLQNHRADCLETWNIVVRMLVQYDLYKLWPWVDLDLFYGMVKFGSLGF